MWVVLFVLITILVVDFLLTPPYKASLNLSNKEIIRCSRDAALGDRDSAMKLWRHYLIVKSDPTNGFMWKEVAGFNGDLDSQHDIASRVREIGIDNYRLLIGRTNEIAEGRIQRWIDAEKNGEKQ